MAENTLLTYFLEGSQAWNIRRQVLHKSKPVWVNNSGNRQKISNNYGWAEIAIFSRKSWLEARAETNC